MSDQAEAQRYFGAGVKRVEDPRFIRGEGRYVDDLKLPHLTHAAFVRSPHAHAKIQGIDTSTAETAEGVVAVHTGQDLAAGGVNPIPTAWLHEGIKIPDRPVIATDRVRYVGEAVAVVVAETAQAAQDAAALVSVDYEPLPAAVETGKATDDDAPRIHDDAPDNVSFEWAIGDAEATEEAFAGAATVVRRALVNQRLLPHAIEPRACVAAWDPGKEELTLHVTSQNPHVHRLIMGAFVLGIPEQKFRVISPDVGGGFGSKIHVYPEECAVSWLAKNLRRPVKWVAERSESFLTDAHGRDHVSDAELALSDDGRILGLRVHTTANMGAYLSLFAPAVPTYLYGTLLSGQYEIPAVHAAVTGVFTNTTPVDAVRGAGRPEAAYLVERMVDLAAAELDLDPVEVRRKNLIPKDAFPYQTPVALTYDSGDYDAALDRALEILDYEEFRRKQEEAREEDRYLGVGFSTYIEACGLAPSQVVGALGAQAGLWESSKVRVHPTGKVTVFTGTHSHGQGHETTFAQVAADHFQVPLEDVEVVHGDTGEIPMGMGTYGSRSAAVGGSAIHMSLEKIREKATKLAAHLLEAAPEDVVLENGSFQVKGAPDRAKAWGDVALAAYLAHDMPEGMEPGLEATSFFDPENFTFPFGTHVAVVEVDPETGFVSLERYVAVDDVGEVINPVIVDGQVHGGIAHGVAQALWETAEYDGSGQFLSGSLMEYALPKADQLPSFEIDRTVTPSPVNPLGVKGAGETGTIASTAAVANAVADALAPFGIDHVDLPLTPSRVWSAIQAAGGGGKEA